MRTFQAMNTSTPEPCPVCKTQKPGEVVLIGLAGTLEGNIMKARQFHLTCLELTYIVEKGLVYQIVPTHPERP